MTFKWDFAIRHCTKPIYGQIFKRNIKNIKKNSIIALQEI